MMTKHMSLPKRNFKLHISEKCLFKLKHNVHSILTIISLWLTSIDMHQDIDISFQILDNFPRYHFELSLNKKFGLF